MKINPAASAVLYSTFLGGGTEDQGIAIAVDSAGDAYVTGATSATNFPTVNPLQSKNGGAYDAFVTKINSTGSAIVYSTYLGRTGADLGFGVSLDAAGNIWVAGATGSMNFPMVNSLQVPFAGTMLFVSEFSPDGSTLLFSSYVNDMTIVPAQGGGGTTSRAGMTLDKAGNVYVTAKNGDNLPPANSLSLGGTSSRVLVFKLSGSGRTFVHDFRGIGRSDELMYDPKLGQEYTALSNANGTYQYVPNLFTPAFDTLRNGDFNGDGKADLVLYNSRIAQAYIGMSNGDGTFTFQSLFWSPGYDVVEPGDLNGDGKTDFALYNSSTGTMYTGISNGDGTFTYKYTLISTTSTR